MKYLLEKDITDYVLSHKSEIRYNEEMRIKELSCENLYLNNADGVVYVLYNGYVVDKIKEGNMFLAKLQDKLAKIHSDICNKDMKRSKLNLDLTGITKDDILRYMDKAITYLKDGKIISGTKFIITETEIGYLDFDIALPKTEIAEIYKYGIQLIKDNRIKEIKRIK